jgi:hypothetical protein
MTPRPTDDAAFLHGLFQGIARTERECYGVMAAHGAKMPTQILTAGGGGQIWFGLQSGPGFWEYRLAPREAAMPRLERRGWFWVL